MKLVYQYMVIFLYFSLTSSLLRPLQVENCDSNSRLVVDEDDNGKFRPERVKKNPIKLFSPPNLIFSISFSLKVAGIPAYIIIIPETLHNIVRSLQ